MVAIQPRVAFVVGLALTASASPYVLEDTGHSAQRVIDDVLVRAMESPSRNLDSPTRARTEMKEDDEKRKEFRSMLWPRQEDYLDTAGKVEIFPEDDDPFVEKRAPREVATTDDGVHHSPRSSRRRPHPRSEGVEVVEKRGTEVEKEPQEKRHHRGHRHHHHGVDYWYYEDSPEEHYPYNDEHVHLHIHEHKRSPANGDVVVDESKPTTQPNEKRRHDDHGHGYRHHHHGDDFWYYDDAPDYHFPYNADHVHEHVHIHEDRRRQHPKDMLSESKMD